MARIRRDWDLISREQRRQGVAELIDFFATERDEEIGMIAAEDILDHFLQNVGINLYNRGVEDSLNFLKERFESLELDLESLLKR